MGMENLIPRVSMTTKLCDKFLVAARLFSLPTKLFSQIETDHARRASGNYGSSVRELGGNTARRCVIVSSQVSFLFPPVLPFGN